VSVEQADILVLGAGIVGVSIAAQLQMRGHQVVLLDRRAAGEETSFGNAGLIQREAVFPHPFPRAPGALLRYALNRAPEAHYHRAMLPRLLGPFARYWYHSHPSRYDIIARNYAALIAHSVDDHLALAEAAGAGDLLRPGGWTQAHQNPRTLAKAVAEAELARREFGVEHEVLDAAALAQREPQLRPGLAGGLHWTQPVAVIDPHALTLAYLALFERRGGAMRLGDAASLRRQGAGWQVTTEGGGAVEAPRVVVAMGAWSPTLTRRWGDRPPIFVKRGYHMHYKPEGNAFLRAPILDVSEGYMLVPMRRGIRLTTGAEFARLGSDPTPVQLARAEIAARRLMPSLGTRLDPAPWVGARPCTPDMLPIIGPASRQPGVWYAFGHGHQGLTLGPTTGRLLAQMIAGERPFTDPEPYRADRF
jgi:D-amino-acid dehydrogenase